MNLAISALALAIVAYLVPNFEFQSTTAIVISAVVLGTINTFIKPIIQLIALPLTLLTFGIAAFLINVFFLWFTSIIVPGFTISGFFSAVLGSLFLTFISWFLHKLEKTD